MTDIRLIDVKEDILADNNSRAEEIRSFLKKKSVFLLNLMSSPGSGKTSLILRTTAALKNSLRFGVIEGDIESIVDAEKISKAGMPAVQLRTGGLCHLDASMIGLALDELDLENLDAVIIENVGNLVCPAEFDTGAVKSVMILSIPEGDDKPLKYPLMFSVCDAVIINKMDYLSGSDFDMPAFCARIRNLNHNAEIFEVSCKTGAGIESWSNWLAEKVNQWKSAPSN
ncbi:MAG: hydrogenase accessory protein HypB [Deltaproteobacteria bacterium HGW-Deltaproteobacteria-12]|nr:MAG: hydrogenase accessory protein HypB [Deltaproteobacteria bacterium HGW-Deltaproteobacteria-12]